MNFYTLILLLGTFSYAVCRPLVRREDTDGTYWFSSYTESWSAGTLTINKVCGDGMYIELANWSEERQFLNGWTIKQKTKGETVVSYTFEYCSIRPESTRKIVANNWTAEADAADFVATDVEIWATGRDIQTYLYDRNGTVVARHIRDSVSSGGMQK